VGTSEAGLSEFSVVWDTVVVSIVSGESSEGSNSVTLAESASGLSDVESLALECGQVSADDSTVYHGGDASGHVWCLDDLLVDGLCVLDHGRLDDVTLQHGLDLFDDGLLDDFIDDGCVDDLRSQGGIDLTRWCDVVLGDGGTSLDDGLAALGWELALLDESGLDLSLVHQLCHLLDIELLALSVDDGLDLLLLYRVDVLVNDHILLDGLHDGGLGSDETNGCALSWLNVSSLAHCKTFSVIWYSIVVSVSSGMEILEIDTAIVVSV